MTRNFEALRQLRRVVADVPEDRLHMAVVTDEASCGTAHCAIGWATTDPWFKEHHPQICVSIWSNMMYRARVVFGLTVGNTDRLFATGAATYSDAFRNNPHAVSKAEVLWNIDELIAGREARAYHAVRPRIRNHVPLPA